MAADGDSWQPGCNCRATTHLPQSPRETPLQPAYLGRFRAPTPEARVNRAFPGWHPENPRG